jgi:hypothetical protein
MPVPAFEWKSYRVPISRDSPVRALAAAPPAGFEVGVEVAMTLVPLPILAAYPTALDKAKILLESAAEIEHALMVQYLYGAYSLKDKSEVTDASQVKALKTWPGLLLGIAREEMGHLMTVQNLLLLLGCAPNFEREDFPPRKDIYPFKLHLEPLTQRSLAKYVVAESPLDAEGIDDIKTVAMGTEGPMINHVGVIYGLLGFIFATEDEMETGATGSPAWDAMVRDIRLAALEQNPDTSAWHISDGDCHPESESQQGDPADWQAPAGPTTSGLRVHRVRDRNEALAALRDIGEQGEGASSGGDTSHFERFLTIYRGVGAIPAFPATDDWPTRKVPTDPKTTDFANRRTRLWVELADLRYALLLGFLEHYFLTSGEDRTLLTAWVFSEMRSRVGYLAIKLTKMERGGENGVAAIAFTLPDRLHLPSAQTARWALHRDRIETSIEKAEMMQREETGEFAEFLNLLLVSDRARLELVKSRTGGQHSNTSFARDILPLFRPKDIEHMIDVAELNFSVYDVVKQNSANILDRLRGIDGFMPPSPDQRWTKAQTDLFQRWIDEGMNA